jgi:iron(III) transport system substrate-binding protein
LPDAARPPKGVTVYVSEDQAFSETILRDFERDTGIKVKRGVRHEEAKSTGVLVVEEEP